MTEQHPWPRVVEVGPYRFEDDSWIGMPQSLDERARAALPTESATFWRALEEGVVQFQRCRACNRYTFFPAGGCQWCGGDLVYETVDARATLNTWTLSMLGFGPGMETPYITAIVNPDVEPELQVMTNLVNVRVCDIRIGMPLVPRVVARRDGALLFYEPAPLDRGSHE
jgi:uncharacterized OB-fold protein